MVSDYEKHKDGYFRRARKSYSQTFNTPEARLKTMLVEAKSRARIKNIEFDVTLDDLKWNDVCPVLGIDIIIGRNKGPGGDINSPSIDRIDNNKGYIKGNVRVISNRANRIKTDMTEEEARLTSENWEKI